MIEGNLMSVNLDRHASKLIPEILKYSLCQMSHVLQIDGINAESGVKVLRTAFYTPLNDVLKITFSEGMEGDELKLEFGFRSGGVGRCWQDHEEVVCDLEDAKMNYSTAWNMSEYQQNMVRPQLKSLLCVPIFNLALFDPNADAPRFNPLVGILTYDSDLDLLNKFIQKETLDEARITAGLLSIALRGRLESILNVENQ